MRAGAAALLLLFAPALFAQPGDNQRAYLELFVNEASKDTVLVYLRGGDVPDDFLIAVEDLEAAGLHGLGGTREVHDGRPYVSLRSLLPEIRFRYDAQALAVRLTAPPAALDRTTLDLRPVLRPEGMVLRKDTSGFLNYSVSADGNGIVTGAGEVGASLRGNLAFTGFSVLPDHRVVRGLSYVVLDDPERMRRFQVGDAIAISTELGGSAQLAGLSLTREFSLDPYFVRQPLPRLSGAILTPSTLEVYVNGALVRRDPVAPGPFEVRNLPVGSGVGQVSYVVRDAFGRTEEFASPYYSAAGVLADGISDYGYHLGFRRLNFGEVSSEYGPPELLARHRFGIGDWLTAGYRFESALQRTGGTSLLASGGPTVALALPVGELDLDAAASADGSTAGGAGAISYSVFTRHLSAGASLRAMSAGYSNLSLPAAVDRPLLQLSGSVGAPIVQRLSVTLQGQLNAMRDAGAASVLTLRTDYYFSNALSLALSASRQRTAGQQPEWLGYATLIYNFGGGTTADLGATGGSSTGSATAGVQKSLPLGEGWGYQLRTTVDRDQATSGLGQVQYQGPGGRPGPDRRDRDGEPAGAGGIRPGPGPWRGGRARLPEQPGDRAHQREREPPDPDAAAVLRKPLAHRRRGRPARLPDRRGRAGGGDHAARGRAGALRRPQDDDGQGAGPDGPERPARGSGLRRDDGRREPAQPPGRRGPVLVRRPDGGEARGEGGVPRRALPVRDGGAGGRGDGGESWDRVVRRGAGRVGGRSPVGPLTPAGPRAP